MNHHEISTDFVVAGGGMAGICAALAAARNGCKVVLVQDRSVLGGNASSEVRMHIVGADNHGTRPGARESGIIEELRLAEASTNLQRSYSQWDLILYDKVAGEPNITLLLDTVCEGCETRAEAGGTKRIMSLRAARHSTEDVFRIKAPLFADCTGDGRLGFEAGADHAVGREAKSAFGECLARDEADRQTLGSSIMFTARRHDIAQPFRAPAWARHFEKSDFAKRPIGNNYEYGFWWSEWGGNLDTLKDNPRIRHELLRIALGVWDYVKNSGEHPDSANWALDWVGAIPGKRESRRFIGPHVLTQQDIESGRLFEDGVAYGGWPLDLHPPTGIDAVDESPCVQHEVPWLYEVPLRALYSRNVGNLFFAGRNISATHVAFSSTRVMATCAVIGQAVGAAAACMKRMGGAADGMIASAFNAKEVAGLRQLLLRDDAFIPSARNEDPGDKARVATAHASDAVAGSEAGCVTDGVTRELFSHLGKWADGRTHRWESRTLPAWVELSWLAEQEIHEIHVTFDSGFQRELILSMSDAHTHKVVRGPQPEVARDFELLCDGRAVVSERGNVQRKRVFRLEKPVRAKTLRLAVSATNGAPSARVFEIRAY